MFENGNIIYFAKAKEHEYIDILKICWRNGKAVGVWLNSTAQLKFFLRGTKWSTELDGI